MTFTEKVKLQMLEKKDLQPCCKISSLSAFVRGAGTLSIQNGKIGFEITTENTLALNYYNEVLASIFGEAGVVLQSDDKLSGKKKYTLQHVTDKSAEILMELGILKHTDSGVGVNFEINKYLIENDCCKVSYVFGAFMGSGSVTIPKKDEKTVTSYHLEFVFSNKKTAYDFSDVLSQIGFMPKLVQRKDSYVIYFKNGEEISEILFVLGATRACFEVKDVIIEKDIRNETNRRINCEMANIDKQITASKMQMNCIEIIEQTIGLESLKPQLRDTAIKRMENPESSLDELAKISGITKSCLNHRLRKIVEIANNL